MLYSCFKLFNSIFLSVPRVQFRLTGVFETSLYLQEDSYIKTTKSYQKPVLRAWLTFIEVPILSDRPTVIICDSNTFNGTKPRILTPLKGSTPRAPGHFATNFILDNSKISRNVLILFNNNQRLL